MLQAIHIAHVMASAHKQLCTHSFLRLRVEPFFFSHMFTVQIAGRIASHLAARIWHGRFGVSLNCVLHRKAICCERGPDKSPRSLKNYSLASHVYYFVDLVVVFQPKLVCLLQNGYHYVIDALTQRFFNNSFHVFWIFCERNAIF